MAKIAVHNPVKLSDSYGHLKFGHINPNNALAGVLIRNGHPGQECEHYMMFMSTGAQKGGTINRCPGVYQIHCGERPVTDIGFMLNVAEGDIVLRANRGRIRMEAENVDVHANQGVINLDSNEKIKHESQRLLKLMVTLLLNSFHLDYVRLSDRIH